MADVVTTGLVGCGGIAGAHVKGLRKLWEAERRSFRFIAACDVEAARAEKRADEIAEFQGSRPTVYTDLEAMLAAEKELQAVDICSVHSNHHSLAVPCLAAGKHVTIEKPLGITMRAARQIVEAAKKAGRVLQTAENYRRDPDNRAVRWAIAEGRIGKPRMIFWIEVSERLAPWGWRDDKAVAGGGWALDGGVHAADLFRFFLGPVTQVYAVSEALHPFRYGKPDTMEDPIPATVEDTVVSVLRFDSGVIGQWTTTSAAPGEKFSHRAIYGDSGAITVWRSVKTRSSEVPWDQFVRDYRASLSAEESERLFPGGVTDSIATELHEFFLAALGGPPVETDGLEGYRAEAVCFGIYESQALGRPVQISEIESLAVEQYQRELNSALGIT